MKKSNRRKFIATAAALSGVIAVSGRDKAWRQKPKMLVHHAIFWLKNPTSTEDRDKLIEGLRTLARVEMIREIHIGILASTEKRPVVDTSWQVSEVMFFNDLAAQAAYQNHPIHLDFVKNYSHLWEKVVVYDAMDV